MINKIQQIFNRSKVFFGQSRQIQRDNLALQLIRNFLPDSTNYFPITGFSVNPHTLACILNDIQINQRKYMIEFGGGVSTISCAKFAKLNNINFQLFTVESDSKYLDILETCLRKENLADFVKLIYAPLQPTSLALEKTPWYSETIQDKFSDTKFDIILVDGPKAGTKKNSLSRFPALPFLVKEKLLADNYAVFLDDSNRNGEQIAIKKWQKDYKLRFINFSDVTSVAFKGKHFNPLLW